MSRRKRNEFISQDLIKAMGHPLRVQILDVLGEQEASPTMLAAMLSESLHNTNYHTDVLVECNCIYLTRTNPGRGAEEHFYRARPEAFVGHQVWRNVPRPITGGLIFASLKSFVNKLVAALKAGTIVHDETPLSAMTLSLDTMGRAQALGIMQATLEHLKAVDEQSRKRAAKSEDALAPMVVGLAFFEAARSSGSKTKGH